MSSPVVWFVLHLYQHYHHFLVITSEKSVPSKSVAGDSSCWQFNVYISHQFYKGDWSLLSVLWFRRILQLKLARSENQLSKNWRPVRTPLRAVKIFLFGGNKSYSGLAELLVESDFSKLTMLDFDELMNWHGDTCPGRGPAWDLTCSCQKANDLLWAFI